MKVSLPQVLIAPVVKWGRPAAIEGVSFRLTVLYGGRGADLATPINWTDPMARLLTSEEPRDTNLWRREKSEWSAFKDTNSSNIGLE